MRLRHRDVVVDVEVPDGLAVLVEPDQRTLDVEEDPHRVFVFIGDERVSFAGRLVDEITRGRRPVVLEITPLARDRVGEDLVRVVVAVHQPGALRHEDVAPLVALRRDPERPRRDRVRDRHVVAVVVRWSIPKVHLRERVRLEDTGNRLQRRPELTLCTFRHGRSSPFRPFRISVTCTSRPCRASRYSSAAARRADSRDHHGHVRHAVRARRAGIIGLEHQHFVALHVTEVRPAVPGLPKTTSASKDHSGALVESKIASAATRSARSTVRASQTASGTSCGGGDSARQTL